MRNQKHENEPIYLTNKERYILWAIASWFQKDRLVTGTLMSKLYSRDIDAKRNRAKYDVLVDARIKEVGDFLKQKEPHQ
jgi:hypothetical protein